MILEGKDFKVTEDGRVICDESGCKIQEGTGSGDIAQNPMCESKAKKLIEALTKTRKSSDKSLTEKLIEGKTEREIEILTELGLLEASEYKKLKDKEPSDEEKEKKKEELRKDQDKKPSDEEGEEKEPKDSEDEEPKDDTEDEEPKDDTEEKDKDKEKDEEK
jgi:hypothetical protein